MCLNNQETTLRFNQALVIRLINTYKMMIKGIPTNCKVISNRMLNPKNTNFVRFPTQPKCLNFKANKGISEISKTLKTIEIILKMQGLKLNPILPYLKIKGIEQIKIALAGVGTPIKEVVCLVSLLNLARRIAEKTGMMNEE